MGPATCVLTSLQMILKYAQDWKLLPFSKFNHPLSGKNVSLHLLFSLMITYLGNFWFLWCFSWQQKYLEFATLMYKMWRNKENNIGNENNKYKRVWNHLVQGQALCLKNPMSIASHLKEQSPKAHDYQW